MVTNSACRAGQERLLCGLVYFLGFLCVDCIHVCMYLLRCICDKTLSSDSKRGTGVPSALGPTLTLSLYMMMVDYNSFYMAYQIQRDLKFSGEILSGCRPPIGTHMSTERNCRSKVSANAGGELIRSMHVPAL
jgi:hypothetical protein